jgi:phage terminase large subunit-like protein
VSDCRWVRKLDARLAKMKKIYAWDEDAAERAVRFIERNLRHWKAPFAGKPFVLSDWQKERIVKPMWGLRDADGRRVFRKAYIQIPRKNGKSALAAAIMLLILCTDGEGLELYTAATKRDQAMIVFKDCVAFVRSSPRLKARLKILAQKITYPERNGVLMPLSSDYNSMDGLNVSAACIDELHAHKSAHLHDVIQTATGSREEPMVLCITTAGENSQGVCFDQYEYACKVLDGSVVDDAFFAFIAEADKDLEWDDPAAFRQANPNLGVSVREDYLEGERKRALEIPSYRKTYERYHLNRWVQGGVDSWLPIESWTKNEQDWDLEDMAGRRCYGGLDLAATTDLTALALAFPMDDGSVRLWVRCFCPEATIFRRAREDRVPYDVWRDEGWVISTPGDVVDYRRVVGEVMRVRQLVKLRTIAYDDWNAVACYTALQEEGVEMVQFVQGLRSFHPPCQEWEKRVLEGSLRVERNPLMRWMAGHVKVLRDASGKMRPVKDYKSSRDRIDGIVAGLMALDACSRGESKESDFTLPPKNIRELMGI